MNSSRPSSRSPAAQHAGDDATHLLEAFPRALHRTAKNWKRLMNARLCGLGLSQPRWMAMLYLSKHPEGLMQRELANQMDIECASLAGLLDRMATDGWVERRPCTTDRRANLVFLSLKSSSTLDQIRKVAAQVSQELLGDVPASDLEGCKVVLETINQRTQHLANRVCTPDSEQV
jgi:MarR family transcriptional regulator for hemolysin